MEYTENVGELHGARVSPASPYHHHHYVSSLLTGPVVDLGTGAVIAYPAALDASGHLRAAPLPMMLDLPMRVALAGAGAMAPLHDALRRAGRHPREAILLLHGPCAESDRPVLRVVLEALRNHGYLVGFGGAGGQSAPLDLIADAAPYLVGLAPDVVARAPLDHRATAVVRAVASLARGVGAHVLAPGVTTEAELAAVRASERALREEIARGGTPSFRDARDRLLHESEDAIVRALEAFTSEQGALASVRKRLEWARIVRKVTVEDHAAKWDEAARTAESDPRFRGFRLRPRLGLVPIGRDPDSGLPEFAHVRSGDAPARDAGGRLALTEATGIVLVLLPPGRFTMGAQKDDADQPNFDALAAPDETPHAVELAAFFLAKHEVTQGQWLRMTGGGNPSFFRPGQVFGGRKTDLLHPVSLVDWHDCNRWFARHGLALPTEAQWEYGCRAGTDTTWWTGSVRETLRTPALAANLLDRSAKAVGAVWPGIEDWPDVDDGFAMTSPVGAFRANAFGLHDVHGNVWEWCRDWYASYETSARLGDGLRGVDPVEYRVIRGGGCCCNAANQRAADRFPHAPETRYFSLGVRACAVAGPGS